jgi:hypothetical protein
LPGQLNNAPHNISHLFLPLAARERQSAVERSIREEARRLRQGEGGEGGGAGGAAAAGRKNIDLENLSFAAGSHFNSSKQCTLPQVGTLEAGAGFGGAVVVSVVCCILAKGWFVLFGRPGIRTDDIRSVSSCTVRAVLQGSYRTVHKGYEEVHVPALKPKPFADGALLPGCAACNRPAMLPACHKSCVRLPDVQHVF